MLDLELYFSERHGGLVKDIILRYYECKVSYMVFTTLTHALMFYYFGILESSHRRLFFNNIFLNVKVYRQYVGNEITQKEQILY